MKYVLRQPGIRRLLLVLGCTFVYGLLLLMTKVAPTFYQPRTDLPNRLPDERLHASVLIRPPGLEIGSKSQLEVRLLGYTPPSNGSEVEPDRVCIDKVLITSEVTDGIMFRESVMTYTYDPVCFDLIPKSTHDTHGGGWLSPPLALSSPGQTTALGPFDLEAEANRFWYPYDTFTVDVKLWLSYSVYLEQQRLGDHQLISFAAVETPDPAGWEITLLPESYASTVWTGSSEGRQFIIRLQRSIVERVVFPFLVLIVYLFILMLCFVNDLGVFVEGGIAVFFGIFGLGQVLLPPNAEIHTIVDVAIWGLYFAFAGVIAYHFGSALARSLRSSRHGPIETGDEPRVPSEPLHRLPSTPTKPSPAQPRLTPSTTPRKAAGLLLMGAAASVLGWILLNPRKRERRTYEGEICDD